MPQVGSDHVWGNDISPPSGVSLGDGLSLGGYWSSDGSGFGAHGVPLNPAAAAAAERRRTRNLITLSVGSLVAVVVFVLGAWAAFSDPARPNSPTTSPTSGGGQSGFVGAPDSKATPKPGQTTGPASNPNGGQPGAGTNPNGSGGGNGQPNPQQTSGNGGTSPVDPPPPAAEPLKAVIGKVGVTTIGGVTALAYRVDVSNPGGVSTTAWTITVKLPPTPVDLGHPLRVQVSGDVSMSQDGRFVTFAPTGDNATVAPGATVSFRFAVEGDVGLMGCVIDGDRKCGIH
jgi:hypothetical protein